MNTLNLSEVLRSSSNNGNGSHFVAKAKKSPEYEAVESDTIRHALAEDIDMGTVQAALDCFRSVTGIYDERDIQAYSLAEGFFQIHDNEYWRFIQLKELGRTPEKLAEFIQYLEENHHIPRSTAYRYMQVGRFLAELSVLSIEFEKLFYEEHGIERIVVLDDAGNLDVEATREANLISRRVRYGDMSTIAGLYNREMVTSSGCRELMAKSILLPPDEFKKAVQEARGEANPMTEEEKILDAGFDLSGVVVPIRPEYTRDDIVQQLKMLMMSVQAGMMDESLQLVKTRQIKPVGSKPTKFIVSEGFKFIAI